MAVPTKPGEDVFDGGPAQRLQRQLGLTALTRPYLGRRAALVAIVGWVPLAVLSALQVLSAGGEQAGSFFTDFAVHARSLVAAPLFVLAERDGILRLGSTARHFVDAGLVAAETRPRFDAAVAATRRRLDSPLAEVGALVCAYVVALIPLISVPSTEFSTWHVAPPGSVTPLSPAGWWNALAAVPLLLVLAFGWLWRVVMWANFLRQMARLPLRLVPGHPDHAAGLQFVDTSLWAFALPTLALGTMIAGLIANRIVHHGASLLQYTHLAIGFVIFAVVIAAGPLLVFMRPLREARVRGVMEYGALASTVGQAFERKWLPRAGIVDEQELQVPDFSATTDLYSTVANVYQIKPVPLSVPSLGLIVGAAVLPFLPIVVTIIPVRDIVGWLAKLLL
jgi:hypothetical protein